MRCRGVDPGVWFFVATVAVVLVLVGYVIGRERRPAAPPADPTGTAELVAVTPSGVKVWRVEGPRCVVPVVVAEGKGGQVAIR